MRKVTTEWDGSTWQPADTVLFVYDGWNLIEELDEAGATTASYVHGLDLSQSLQGAGGIGGILARIDHGASKSHIYFYDANGNVGQLVDSADGGIVAAYEYAPFGGLTSSMGSYAEVNPFRFSTKYADDVAELYYYGYRYYSPVLGRWVSRDPIGEEGGLNLYGFVGNEPVDSVDPYGNAAYEIADKFDEYYDESLLALDVWVKRGGCYAWVVAATIKTAMDVGEGTIDTLRLGEGFAEGGASNIVTDIFRALGIAGGSGAASLKTANIVKVRLSPRGKVISETKTTVEEAVNSFAQRVRSEINIAPKSIGKFGADDLAIGAESRWIITRMG